MLLPSLPEELEQSLGWIERVRCAEDFRAQRIDLAPHARRALLEAPIA